MANIRSDDDDTDDGANICCDQHCDGHSFSTRFSYEMITTFKTKTSLFCNYLVGSQGSKGWWNLKLQLALVGPDLVGISSLHAIFGRIQLLLEVRRDPVYCRAKKQKFTWIPSSPPTA